MTTTRTLYLAWQDPDGRSWYPVAVVRFDDREGYSFQYIEGARAAQEAPGFPGVAQFPSLDVRYTSEDIFPFLKNRVLGPNRGDFGKYAGRLGLGDDELLHSVHAFDLLSRSNGRRATDTFELFAGPEVTRERARFVFFSRGVRHLPDEIQALWKERAPVEPLRVLLEPGNSYDANATLLTSQELLPLGFVPRYYSESVARLIVGGCLSQAVIAHHNPTPAPPRERFLVQLEIEVPDGWSFPESDLFSEIEPTESAAAE
jgi:hypothetical protein